MKIHRPKLIVVPRPEPRATLPAGSRTGYGVRFQTELCDASGKVERVLTPWRRNMITDFGMNNLPVSGVHVLCNYLNLSSTGQTLKRLGGGVNFTVTWTDPVTITVTTDAGFFVSGDAGRTLFINHDSWPELLIATFVNSQEVTCVARNSAWLPGFTPPTSPAGPYTDVGVHYTNLNTLAAEFTRFNTYDTGSANNNAELTDSANSRFIHQRIFLSGVVTGSDWTVNALGWSNNSANVLGQSTLSSADTIPVGKRYRVTLQVFSKYTPIDLSAVSLDWGATVGTHSCDIRQERLALDSRPGSTTDPNNRFNILRPLTPTMLDRGWWTTAFTMSSVQWEGDAGFTNLFSRAGANQNSGNVTDTSYTNGTFYRQRTITWPETITITGAVALFAGAVNASTRYPCITIKPTSGTITKPSGWRIGLTIPLHWTRLLIN
jgi:hypothetical protein